MLEERYSMSEKQLTKFLFYLSEDALREYLFNADIYKGRKRLSKNELIEMIITDKPQPIKQFDKYEELMNEDAIMQISNN